MKEPTSQSQVLATPEILEAILLQLPLKDLLTNAQRINHTWKTLINFSPLLQQALFFQPQSFAGPEPIINPLLQHSFPIIFDHAMEGHVKQHLKMHWVEDLHHLEWNSTTSKQKAYSRAEASWRRMLPAQPPTRTLELVKVTHMDGADGECSGERVFDDGVRMGTLWDLVQDQVVKPISRFGIKWVSENRYEDGVGRLNWEEKTNETDSRVITILEWTMQCCVDEEDDFGEEFRSEGYEEVKIDFGEEKWDEH
jgi:hypothetical protein